MGNLGYVPTIPDGLSCRHKTLSSVVRTTTAYDMTGASHVHFHILNIVPGQLMREFWGLNPSPHSWIFTSFSVGFSPLSYIIHLCYGPNTCSCCTKVWHRTWSNKWTSTFEISAVELCSITEIMAKSLLSCVKRSPTRYSFRAGARTIRYSWFATTFLDTKHGHGRR